MRLPLPIDEYNNHDTIVLDEINLMWNIDHIAEELLCATYTRLGFEWSNDEEPMHCTSEKWNEAIDTLTNVFKKELEKHKPKGSHIAWVENP